MNANAHIHDTNPNSNPNILLGDSIKLKSSSGNAGGTSDMIGFKSEFRCMLSFPFSAVPSFLKKLKTSTSVYSFKTSQSTPPNGKAKRK
jgi:hypothetical protein